MKKPSFPLRKGLLAGGNWLIDHVKLIDAYPAPETLAKIRGEHTGTGGAPYNVLTTLAQAGAPFPLYAAGCVGKDTDGTSILQHCRALKIITRHLRTTLAAPTSYTDVMTEVATGRRTFFHARGANALWDGAQNPARTLPPTCIRRLGFKL